MVKKLWHVLLLTLVLALIVRSCEAQQTRLKVKGREKVCQNGYCKIQEFVGYGGCVFIGKAPNGNWIFATAAHNLLNAYDLQVMLDGEWSIASKVIADSKTDAALIVTFPGKQRIECSHFGENTVRGEKLILQGLIYGRAEQTIRGYSLSRNVLRMERDVTTGNSGCPILRQDGSIVGIQSAKDKGNLAFIVPASVYRGMIKKRWDKLTCWRIQSPVTVGLRPPVQHVHKYNCDCRNQFVKLHSEIAYLKKQITILQNRKPHVVDNSGIEQYLNEYEKRLAALEPLLNRRLQLVKEDGTVTADRTYKPGDTMKIRGVYKSK